MLVYAFVYGSWWMWILSFLIWNIIGSIGISIGYHRLLSHKSFHASDFFIKLSSLVGCLATGGAPLSWVGAHRLHHLEPDGKKDPHSPIKKGFFNVYFHLWGKVYIPRKLVQDLLKSDFQKFLYKKYFLILSLWVALLYLIDPLVGVFVYSVPAALAFHAFGLINTLGHRNGYRTYNVNDTSTNNFLVNIFTCGEGWHNNHHKFPSHYRIGLKKSEYDLSAFLIEKFKLSRKPLPKLPKSFTT